VGTLNHSFSLTATVRGLPPGLAEAAPHPPRAKPESEQKEVFRHREKWSAERRSIAEGRRLRAAIVSANQAAGHLEPLIKQRLATRRETPE